MFSLENIIKKFGKSKNKSALQGYFSKLSTIDAENFFRSLSIEIKKALSEPDFTTCESLLAIFDTLIPICKPEVFKRHFEYIDFPSFAISACKKEDLTLLRYILCTNCSSLVKDKCKSYLTTIKDELGHNIYYHALKSENIDILDTLLYDLSDEVTMSMVMSFEKFKLKNIRIPVEFDLCAINRAASAFPFYTHALTGKAETNTKRAVEMISYYMSMLITEYASTKTAGDVLFTIIKIIIRQLHAIKLGEILPKCWEQLLFCFNIYLGIFMTDSEMNIIYSISLNTENIIRYVQVMSSFAINGGALSEIQTNGCSELEKVKNNLASNYWEVKNHYYIDKMRHYAIYGTLESRNGLERVIQQIKRYLQPDVLSPDIRNLLLLCAPNEVGNTTADVFDNLEKFSDCLRYISFRKKLDIFKRYLKKIASSEECKDDIHRIFHGIRFGCTIKDAMKFRELEHILHIYRDTLVVNDLDPNNLTKFMHKCFNISGEKLDDSSMNYTLAISGVINYSPSELPVGHMRNVETTAQKYLNNIDFSSSNNLHYSSIIHLCGMALENALNIVNERRIVGEDVDSTFNEMKDLYRQICFISSYESGNIDYLRTFYDKYEGNTLNETIEEVSVERSLDDKMEELKTIVKLQFFEGEDMKGSLSNVELLIYDILSNLPGFGCQIDLCSEIANKSSFLQFLYLGNPLITEDTIALAIATKLCFYKTFDCIKKDVRVQRSINETKELCDSLINDVKCQMDMLKAVGKGDLVKVDECIKNGADFNGSDFRSRTPMHYAAKCGKMEIMRYIFMRSTGVNVRKDDKQRLPLHITIKYGHFEAFVYLLQCGSPNTALDSYRRTPLHYAAMYGRFPIVDKLLKLEENSRCDYDANGLMPAHLAAKYNNFECVKLLLSHESAVDINISVGGATALMIVAEYGYLYATEELLTLGANVNHCDIYNMRPLHLAAMRGHVKVVDKLISYGANPIAISTENRTPLHFAITVKNPELLSLFMEEVEGEVIDPESDNEPYLHTAIKTLKRHFVEMLLEYDVSVDSPNREGVTSLHVAASYGCLDIVLILLTYGADMDAIDSKGNTVLHYATSKNNIDTIKFFLDNEGSVDKQNSSGETILHVAAKLGHDDTLQALLLYNANVNIKDNYLETPLHYACKHRNFNVVHSLLKHGAKIFDLNYFRNLPIDLSIISGDIETVKLLIQFGSGMYFNQPDNRTIHLAAVKGDPDIMHAVISGGASVNSVSLYGYTPLHIAASLGNLKAVKMLVEQGADFYQGDANGKTALCIAAESNQSDVVNYMISLQSVEHRGKAPYISPTRFLARLTLTDCVDLDVVSNKRDSINELAEHGDYDEVIEILLSRGACLNPELVESRIENTPLAVAASLGNIAVARTLIEKDETLLNRFENAIGTALHIAANEGRLNMVVFLMRIGYDIKQLNEDDAMPIHLAAQEARLDVIKYLLRKGNKISDTGGSGRTLIHYGVLSGSMDIITFLISKGSKINEPDEDENTPLHYAAMAGHNDLVRSLLMQGAYFDLRNVEGKKAIDVARERVILSLLLSVEIAFSSVDTNDFRKIKDSLDVGVPIDTKNSNDETLLILASRKDNFTLVKTLLDRGASVNAVDNLGNSSLHFACKSSSYDTVKLLLCFEAEYNILNRNGRTPLDLTVHGKVGELIKTIDKMFKDVMHAKPRIVGELNKITDATILKAFVKARNREGKNILVLALQKNFPKIDKLKCVLLGSLFNEIQYIDGLITNERSQDALNNLTRVIKNVSEVLGENHPVTWDVQRKKAFCYYKLEKFEESSELYKQIHYKQIDALGFDNPQTLDTWVGLGMSLEHITEDDEPMNIFKQAFIKQREILGPEHPATLSTQLNLATTLAKFRRYREAAEMYRECLDKSVKLYGMNSLHVFGIKNNIADMYINQRRFEEAIMLFNEVYAGRKRLLGPSHMDTLRTLHSKATAHLEMDEVTECLDALTEVYTKQRAVFGNENPDVLKILLNIANLHYTKTNWTLALAKYKDAHAGLLKIYGESNDSVRLASDRIGMCETRLKESGEANKSLTVTSIELHSACKDGKLNSVRLLIEAGHNVDSQDNKGRTALYFAVSGTYCGLVTYLLKNGANVMATTVNGQSVLHKAAAIGSKQITEILLQNIKKRGVFTLNNIVNNILDENLNSALHIAAKSNYLSIVYTLLNYGAIYNSRNKSELTPARLTNDEFIRKVLQRVDVFFNDCAAGNEGEMQRLKTLRRIELCAVLNCRNKENQTMLQVAIANKHREVANRIMEMLKRLQK